MSSDEDLDKRIRLKCLELASMLYARPGWIGPEDLILDFADEMADYAIKGARPEKTKEENKTWTPCGHDDPSWCTDDCIPPWKKEGT
jgi:hypothetical protein